eukprot:CAMPEP_0174251556 /NCGR_PEP_ID=MMETSP0439-20130205/1343_1 /TAXON_ID=0 /ORGANISM="Stereomyxa ramosa, Strain Chinc5" /LENGTH=113 /DNA_ID=CAMNT_0015331897 /DNA_START=95 /DNA_END=436 /DNA_ORIENTATION=+
MDLTEFDAAFPMEQATNWTLPTHQKSPEVHVYSNTVVVEQDDACAACCMGFLMGFFFHLFGLCCICCFKNKKYYLLGFFIPVIVTSITAIIGLVIATVLTDSLYASIVESLNN